MMRYELCIIIIIIIIIIKGLSHTLIIIAKGLSYTLGIGKYTDVQLK